ncbi:MAG: Gfo/Idh/MocA family oxidoreductase [Verrucomicrobiota bacterium]
MSTINIAIVGCGSIALQNHLPGLALCPGVKVVALCDNDEATLARAQAQTGVRISSNRHEDIVKRDDVDAVIIATPNVTHPQIALDAIAHGKHVLCEKPLGLKAAEANAMARAADQAKVRHMTAFTYRFVPAMRYLSHLVQRGDLGQPYHYRSCRLQDWGTRGLGWRQVKKLAGSGELGDMLSHRIDFAHLLAGPMKRLVANMKIFHPLRGGQPNDLDDSVAILSDFKSGATGVLESSKLASGRNEIWRSLDYVELNGADRSFVFITGEWNKLQTGKAGGAGMEPIEIPKEFWKIPGSPRDPTEGDPLVTFRYDQAWEFVDAIHNQRPCSPSFHDGARAQTVMDAAVQSSERRQWVEFE